MASVAASASARAVIRALAEPLFRPEPAFSSWVKSVRSWGMDDGSHGK